MNNEIVIYTAPDGRIKLDVQFVDDSFWLTIDQIAELFGRSRSTINEHILNVFEEGELDKTKVMRKIGKTDFSTKPTNLYNLDVIIAVGYRVKSTIGTNFRIWATERLHEYIQKGFTMNDELLKNAGGGQYWKELLARIRDIRTSEKVFYRQILDIYATSVDYDPKSPSTLEFFKTVQNKMHYAVHHNTAAELIAKRADGNKDFSGMTTWTGDLPQISDAVIAKNYLSKEELDKLNRLTTMFLDQAEYMANEHTPMTMADWVNELHGLLKLMRSDILSGSGKLSHEAAVDKARAEFGKYKNRIAKELTGVEKSYLESLRDAQNLIESSLSDDDKDSKRGKK